MAMTRPQLLAALMAACLWLGGCATPAGGLNEPLATGLGGRIVALPTPRQRLVHLALQEWRLWGRSRWDAATDTYAWSVTPPRREHLPDAVSRVLLYWRLLRGDAFRAEEAQYPDGSLLPWSAVFISFLMKSAGIPDEVFPSSALHWHYLQAVADAPNPLGFEALDAALAPPAVGDLICAPRDGTALRVTRFEQLAGPDSAGGYHCDLVVKLGAGTLGAIGGNVRDGVTWSVVPLDGQGLLRPTPRRHWLVVLRNHLP
jgi:hypothetical protein